MTEPDPAELEVRVLYLRNGALPLAVRNTELSLQTARDLLAAGFPSPAYVWAIRSAEIFFREALLFPLQCMRTGEVLQSLKWAQLKAGKWDTALRLVREGYGLVGDEYRMLTVEDEDFWAAWKWAFGQRGEVVHGRDEAVAAHAENAIVAVEQLRQWFLLRVTMAKVGPFAGLMREMLTVALALAQEDPDER